MSHDDASGAQGSTPVRSFHGRFRATARLFGPTLAVGLVAPFIFPSLRRAAKPVAKGLIKGALILSESAKEAAAVANEHLTDLMAEVRAEREQEARDAADKTDTS
jgi:Protein of unknown function (DUF5132)